MFNFETILRDGAVYKFIKSFNIESKSPIFIWNKFKEDFFKFSFDSNIFSGNWNNFNFDGKIVETLEWYQSDNLENYLKQGNKEYENKKVVYEMNEHGFRTNSKTNEVKKNKKIACFGCSHTMGEGLLWEETWPYALNEMVGDEWDVRNYAVCGASNDMISRLVYNYTLKNKPDFICIHFTEVLRMELFDVQSENFNNFIPTDTDEISKWKNFEKWKTYRAYRTIANEENGIHNFIKNFKFIEMICKNKNIPWYWSTWSIPIIFSSNEFKREILNIDNYCKMNEDVDSYLDVARDGGHFGVKTCKEIAKIFFEKLNYDNKILG